KWLRDEIEGTFLHTFHSKFDSRESCQKDDGKRWVSLAHSGEYVQTFSVSHLLIRENSIKVFCIQMSSGLSESARPRRDVPVKRKRGRQDSPHMRLVIDDQDAAHFFSLSLLFVETVAGSSSVKQTRPGSLTLRNKSPP